jgi:hypothetical protein
MSDQDTISDIRFFAAFRRPAWVIMMVAQMLLGLGLAVALIVKYYMLIFGTSVCAADTDTLGNIIRCTPTLTMAAHFVLGVAGFRFAAFMFQDRPRAILPPMMLSFAGMLLLFLQSVTPESATWPVAAVIVTLLGCMSAVFAAQYLLVRGKDRSE